VSRAKKKKKHGPSQGGCGLDSPRVSSEAYSNEPVRFSHLEVVNLRAFASAVKGDFSNSVINRVNGHCLRLAVLQGDYPWHIHPSSDELFLVVEGELIIEVKDGPTLEIGPWQVATVPAGVIHRTRAATRTVNLCFEELSADTAFLEEEPAL
jgi:mannose-6-phosphate isomerase-like protein (cupin superfamily)